MRLALWTRHAWALIALVATVSVASQSFAQPVPRPERKGRKYRVRIDSAPQRAAIYLDAEKYGIVGYTPWEGRLRKGDWKVILKKDGYKSAERYMRIRRSRRVQETFMTLTEKEMPAKVSVRGDADNSAVNAEVWVDGQKRGKIPVELEVDEGRHLVQVKKEGFHDFSQWLSAKEGETITVNPVLKSSKPAGTGSILVHSEPSGGEVYVDGEKYEDTTPTLIGDVIAGAHVVEVRKNSEEAWKQTVEVKAGETVKVAATLGEDSPGGEGGTVRVLSNVEGATVYLDGTEVDDVPIDIEDVSAGEHVVEVKADGYAPREERIEVEPGESMVLKLDLRQGSGGDAELKIVSPVPEAEVYIDGQKAGSVPQRKELSSGEHFVVVSKPGYKKFEEKINVEPGQSITVTAELKAVGQLRLISTPAGAGVFIDGERVGATPMTHEVGTGEHVVGFRAQGYVEHQETVTVKGGETSVINAGLEIVDTGPTAAEIEREVRSLTSFGARTLPRGRSTIDMAVGYPYFFDGRITVGASDIGPYGFDAGVFFRSFVTRSELGLSGRMKLFEQSPFSFGAFADLGGGGNFFDDSERNTFFGNLGVVASLSALQYVTVSGRAYVNAWSDRHCPEVAGGRFLPETEPIDTCVNYRATEMGNSASGFSNADKQRIDDLFGGDSVYTREEGIRGILSGAVEIAIRQRWNVWLIFEGAPFQEERAAYTDYFNAPMFEDDIGTYLRLGSTLKF